ncbi:MAG: hypothetical protein HQL58_09350 [Magnetococcales bacterium]|nr:hypothetical protein [Magnetococcales bacterium]
MNKHQSGFAMIQLAMLMTVVGATIYITLPALVGTGAFGNKSAGSNQEYMRTVRDAIEVYAIANKKLPPPVSGYLPYSALGLMSDQDMYNNKIKYAIGSGLDTNATSTIKEFCDKLTVPAGSNTALLHTDNGTVQYNVPFVIASSGANSTFDGNNAVNAIKFATPDQSITSSYDDVVMDSSYGRVTGLTTADAEKKNWPGKAMDNLYSYLDCGRMADYRFTVGGTSTAKTNAYYTPDASLDLVVYTSASAGTSDLPCWYNGDTNATANGCDTSSKFTTAAPDTTANHCTTVIDPTNKVATFASSTTQLNFYQIPASVLNGLGDLTITLWVKPTIDNTSDSKTRTIISGTNASGSELFSVDRNQTNQLAVTIKSTSTSTWTPSVPTISTNAWNFIAVTRAGTSGAVKAVVYTADSDLDPSDGNQRSATGTILTKTGNISVVSSSDNTYDYEEPPLVLGVKYDPTQSWIKTLGTLQAGSGCNVSNPNSVGQFYPALCSHANPPANRECNKACYTGPGGTDNTTTQTKWPLNNQFIGSMDDLRIYNRVLTLREIQRIYNAQKTKNVCG